MSSNPFDVSKIFKQFQDNPLTSTMENNNIFKSVSDAFFKADQPKDMGELWEMQKKNLEVMTRGDLELGEKMSVLAKRQSELFQEAMKSYEHYTARAQAGEDVDKSGMEAAQEAMLGAMKNMQSLGQKNWEASKSAGEDMQNAMAKSVDDLQAFMKKFGK